MKYFEIELEDEQTETMTRAHAVSGINVDFCNKYMSVEISHWTSVKALKGSKKPVSWSSYTFYGEQPRGVVLEDYALEKVREASECAVDGNVIVNPLKGVAISDTGEE